MLSSRSFIVMHFTFRHVVHSELIFVNGTRAVCRFTFFACGCPGVPTPFAEKMCHSTAFTLLSKTSWSYLGGLISGLSTLFHWCICLFFCRHHTVDHCSFLCSKSYNQACRFFDFVLSALFFPLFPWLLDTDAAVNSGFFLLLSSPVLMDHLLHHTSSFFPPELCLQALFPAPHIDRVTLGAFKMRNRILEWSI